MRTRRIRHGVRREELDDLASRLRGVNVAGDEGQAMARFVSWLETARSRDQSLVFFYY